MNKFNHKYPNTSFWIIIVAAVALEAISCLQYFSTRAAIRQEAEQRAKTELRKAELEIEKHTVEMETAAKALAMLVEKYVDRPDSVYSATNLTIQTIREYTSMAVAYVPDYFPKHGRYFEVCSSRISEDSVYTRQIGSAKHDYTQMEWYQNGFVHDSCWWCEPYMDDSGSETMVVSCSCPIRNKKGEVVAVVCIDMSLHFLQEKLPEYLQVYPNSYYAILSSTGSDIVRVMDTVPGRKYNKFDEEIDATGWHIEIVIPEDEMFADLNRIGRLVGLFMFLGLGLLLLILWYAGRNNKKLIDTTAQNERMENELYIANAIQSAMLPRVFPPFLDRLDLNVYGIVDPAKEVGGDLYDFYVRHDKLFFCVGDVSGKGVPAALVMAMTRSLFRSITSHEEDAAKIMKLMNNAISDQNEQNMFITLFLGVLDIKTGVVDYCNAGHNAPMFKTSAGWHKANVDANLPLGVMSGYEFKSQQISIQPNDTVLLYTDGLTEAENQLHEQFGEERTLNLLSSLRNSRPRYIVEQMKAEVENFVNGAEQSDDLTMLAIRFQVPTLVMRNDIQQIPTLVEWIGWLGIPEELNMPVNLALEEAVTNVMLYAYPGKSGQVLVEFAQVNNNLIFTISDSGIPFDPTQQAEADITLSAEERSIGGLGIHLVRQLMDEVNYTREDNKNILTLIKQI